APGAVHVYHQYTVRVEAGERDRMVAALREEHGVGAGVYYPTPAHRLASLAPCARAELPETDRAAGEVVSLPVHPALAPEARASGVAAVSAVAGGGAWWRCGWG